MITQIYLEFFGVYSLDELEQPFQEVNYELYEI